MSNGEVVFLEQLLKFYTNSLVSLSEAISILADIEDENKELYLKLIATRDNPILLLDQISDLTSEQRDTMILIFTKLSLLGEKSNRLFELTVDEKRGLSKEIRDFEKDSIDKIKQMVDAE